MDIDKLKEVLDGVNSAVFYTHIDRNGNTIEFRKPNFGDYNKLKNFWNEHNQVETMILFDNHVDTVLSNMTVGGSKIDWCYLSDSDKIKVIDKLFALKDTVHYQCKVCNHSVELTAKDFIKPDMKYENIVFNLGEDTVEIKLKKPCRAEDYRYDAVLSKRVADGEFEGAFGLLLSSFEQFVKYVDDVQLNGNSVEGFTTMQYETQIQVLCGMPLEDDAIGAISDLLVGDGIHNSKTIVCETCGNTNHHKFQSFKHFNFSE